MIPRRIVEYLGDRSIPYQERPHRRAITAPELAAMVHVPGRRVAKSVLVKAGDQIWIAVLPATEFVDERRLAAVLGVESARLLHETEFEGLFPDCEPGAEPPFGALYGLPVVVDSALADADRIVLRAGSHEEAIELRFDDFLRLERGARVGPIGCARPIPPPLWGGWEDWCAR